MWWDLSSGWDPTSGWDLACGWDLASGWDLALWMKSSQWLERLIANAKAPTVLGLIPGSFDTAASEERQMKQCWIKYIKNKSKNSPVYCLRELDNQHVLRSKEQHDPALKTDWDRLKSQQASDRLRNILSSDRLWTHSSNWWRSQSSDRLRSQSSDRLRSHAEIWSIEKPELWSTEKSELWSIEKSGLWSIEELTAFLSVRKTAC